MREVTTTATDPAGEDGGLRIVHVTDFCWPRAGGIETHVLDLANRQASAGHQRQHSHLEPRTGRTGAGGGAGAPAGPQWSLPRAQQPVEPADEPPGC